jgi:hypothetical protein
MVNLVIDDMQGQRSTFRLTLPQAAIGFIVNPIIEDSDDYVCFAMGTAKRKASTLTLQVQRGAVTFFRDAADLQLSELPPAAER